MDSTIHNFGRIQRFIWTPPIMLIFSLTPWLKSTLLEYFFLLGDIRWPLLHFTSLTYNSLQSWIIIFVHRMLALAAAVELNIWYYHFQTERFFDGPFWRREPCQAGSVWIEYTISLFKFNSTQPYVRGILHRISSATFLQLKIILETARFKPQTFWVPVKHASNSSNWAVPTGFYSFKARCKRKEIEKRWIGVIEI